MFVCAIPKLEAWAEPGTPEGDLRRHLWLAAHEIAARDKSKRPRGVIKAGLTLSNTLTIAALHVHPARFAELVAEDEYKFANTMLQNLRMRDRRETGFVCAIPKLEAWAKPGTPEGDLRRHLWLAAHEIAARDKSKRPRGVIKAGLTLSNTLTIAALHVHPARFAELVAEDEHEFANAMLQNLRMRDRRETSINQRAPLARWHT